MAIRHVDMTQGAEGEGDSKHAKKKASSSNKAFKAAQKGKPLDEAAVFDAYADEGYLDLKALGKAVRATGRKCSPQQASALLAMYARAAPLRAAPRRAPAPPVFHACGSPRCRARAPFHDGGGFPRSSPGTTRTRTGSSTARSGRRSCTRTTSRPRPRSPTCSPSSRRRSTSTPRRWTATRRSSSTSCSSRSSSCAAASRALLRLARARRSRGPPPPFSGRALHAERRGPGRREHRRVANSGPARADASSLSRELERARPSSRLALARRRGDAERARHRRRRRPVVRDGRRHHRLAERDGRDHLHDADVRRLPRGSRG